MVNQNRFSTVIADLNRRFSKSKSAVVPTVDESAPSEALKNAQTAIDQKPINDEIYALETLKRSLSFVTKIDIETEETISKIANVIVYYNNGMTAKIECFRKPEKTEELINIALAGSHQCLSDLSYAALFTYAGKERRVWRKVVDIKAEDGQIPVIISSILECDEPKFNQAVPSGAPGLRDILLSIPGVACLPGENTTSNNQVNRLKFESIEDPRVAMVERGRIKHDREEKPRLDKTTAKRATNAMAELLMSVGIDGDKEK